MQRMVKVVTWGAAVVVGLVIASIVFVEGWELPLRYECGGGDACVAGNRYDVDWAIVNWSLTPTRIACFDPNPGRHSVIVGPGDVCVSADGEREVRATYEEMRDSIRRRRLATLAIMAGVLAAAPTVAALVVSRRRVRRRRVAGS